MGARVEKIRREYARRMRREPTEPEKRLWRCLSNSQLGGFKFRRQTVVGQYICDFSCSWNGLIVEVDGETHNAIIDAQRDQYLRALGYNVMRVSNRDVMTNMEGVLLLILRHCERLPERRYAPTPAPPLEGRGF